MNTHSDLQSGTCTITFESPAGITYRLDIDWEVAAGSLDWSLTRIEARDETDLLATFDHSHIKSGAYGIPRFLVERYGPRLEEKIWNEIRDHIHIRQERDYVN